MFDVESNMKFAKSLVWDSLVQDMIEVHSIYSTYHVVNYPDVMFILKYRCIIQ